MLDWYPGARAVPADPTNYRRVGRKSFDLVVCHVTDGRPAAMPVAQMWREPHHGSSAHFVIGQDGTVLQCVALSDVAYHAHSANGHSVGIEHCARTPGELGPSDPGLPLSEAQYTSSQLLLKWLCTQAGIPFDRAHVKGHAEADPATTHQRCPLGAGWDWAKLFNPDLDLKKS